MGAGSHRGHGHGDDDDDDSDDGEPQEAESWFAGGERRYESPCPSCDGLLHFRCILIVYVRSGISVENPDAARNIPGGDVVRDLLRRAAEYVLDNFYTFCPYTLRRISWRSDADVLYNVSLCTGPLSSLSLSPTSLHNRAGPPPEPAGGAPGARRPGFFSGGGHTLGSDEVESTFIPDPTAPAEGSSESPSLLYFLAFGMPFSPLLEFLSTSSLRFLNFISI